jgi:phospholipid transport system substrate-binding protein
MINAEKWLMIRNLNAPYLTLVLLALSISLLATTKGLAEELQPPQQVIQSVSEQLQTKLQDKVFTKSFVQVTRFVNDVIYPHTDFDKIAPLVLGKHWKTASANEKMRFKQEFQTLLVRIYSRAFVEYKDWSIRFPPLQMPNQATKVIVKTKVYQPGMQPVEVNYRMFLSKGDWKVYDIMIDGVSLVTNYRTSFNNEIHTKGSLGAVIDDLAKRNTEALSDKRS